MVDARIIHEGDETLGEGGSNRRVLASTVDIADSTLSQAKGLMFQSTLPEEYALVLEVGGDSLLPIPRGPPRHFVHMLFVRTPLDVIWVVDDKVTKKAQMYPWRSMGMGKADRIIELPAGAADGVKAGDTVYVETVDGERLDAQ